MKRIENRYREIAVRIRGTETIRIKTKRLVNSAKSFVAKRKVCMKSFSERRKQEKFHRNIYNTFDVTDNSSVQQRQTFDSSAGFSDSFSSQESDATSFSDCYSSPDSNPDSDPDKSDPDDSDYDPSGDICSSQKKPVPTSLLKDVSKSRGSYRLCESLLNVGVKIAGTNPSAYALSKSSLWSKITQFRDAQKNELLSSLEADNCKIVLHFDGKSCSMLNKRHVGKEERFIILCHTNKGDVPLGFFALNSKSGRDCSAQILKSLADYNLSNRVVGLVSDTESTNTGTANGTCALVENGLELELLHLMCRHHIKEVLLRDVFVAIFGASQAARITTFDVLIENWDYIESRGFIYSPLDQETLYENPLLARLSEETIDIIGGHAKCKHVRDDYAELNDLVLKFLGIQTGKPFRVVGATSNARWMARIIYAIKTYLFREHLLLDSEFVDAIERFCIFVTLIYTKHWNRCVNAVDAPYNDVQLLKELNEYAEYDGEIADVAMAAHKRHLWYLSDELSVLALFSSKVSAEEKQNMIAQMTPDVGDRTENSIKHTSEIDDIENIELHNFISPRSFFLFELLQLDVGFLGENPDNWDEMNDYKRAKQTISSLITVVNDSAERALQLGANAIVNQKVRSELALQNFVISTYGKNNSNSLF